MKKLLKNSFFRILIIIFGNLCMGIFLFTYILPNTVTTQLTAILTIILFIIFMLIFTITMTCELCFDEGSKHLVAYGDLEKAHRWMQTMRRIDILGWYKSQYCVFMSVYYRDSNRMEDLRNLLQDKTFQKNESMKLVYHYNQMLLAIEANQSEEVDVYYQNVQNSYTSKDEKKKTALIYSIDMVNAERNLYYKKCKDVKNNLDRVNTKKNNGRENAHYNYLRYRQFYCSGNKNRAQQYLHLAHELYPQGKCFLEIEDKR